MQCLDNLTKRLMTQTDVHLKCSLPRLGAETLEVQ